MKKIKTAKKISKQIPKFVVGIDEAGRGPLAGPVSVGGIFMTEKAYLKLKNTGKLKGLHNSKKLSEKQREEWFEKIKEWKKRGMLDFSYSSQSAKIIDEIGISVAIRKSLGQILINFETPEESRILLDGSLYAPKKFINQETIIRGDESESIISLASIVAKVRRDNFIKKIALEYPKYHLEVNKGYGTKRHLSAIEKNGLSDLHRKSFCKRFL